MSSSPDTLQRTLNAPIFASPGLGFVFEHCQQPRTQLPECANANHALCIVQSHPGQTRITVNRQQQRQVARPGEVWLLPAQQITQSQWDGHLDYFRLLIRPQWLRELANDVTGVQQYALDLQLQVLDPLLFQIALALKTELTDSTQPDFLYMESLSHTLGRHLLRRYASCSPDLHWQYPKREFQRCDRIYSRPSPRPNSLSGSGEGGTYESQLLCRTVQADDGDFSLPIRDPMSYSNGPKTST